MIKKPPKPDKICPKCKGKKTVKVAGSDADWPCPQCAGTGKVKYLTKRM